MVATAATRGMIGACADVVADAYAVVKLRASVDGTDAEYSIAQMIWFRVTKWSLFGDEFSNLLRERDC